MGKVLQFPKNPNLTKLTRKRDLSNFQINPESIASEIKKEIDLLQEIVDMRVCGADDLIHDFLGGNGPQFPTIRNPK